MAPVLGNKAVPFLRKSARLTLGKWHGLCRTSATGLGKNCHRLRENQQRLWENQPPTVGKSATDFGKISNRLRENQPPTLGKSATDFGKISHRLWENQLPTLGNLSPTLGKSATDFGKSVTDFEEIRHRFCEAPFFWMNRLRFSDKLSLKMKSTGGKLEG